MMSRMRGMRSVRIETSKVGIKEVNVRAVAGWDLRYVSSAGMMDAMLVI